MKLLFNRIACLLLASWTAVRLVAQGDPADPALGGVTLTIQSPASGATFDFGAAIPIEATAVDTAGGITRLEFLAGNAVIGVSEILTFAPVTPGEPVQHAFLWRDPPAGRHELRARGQGADGAWTQSAPVSVQVGAVAPVATVVMQAPADGTEITLGAEIEIVAEATDPAGLIDTLEFFANGKKIGASTVDFCPPCLNPPCPLLACSLPPVGASLVHRFVWSPDGAGVYSVEARALLADGTPVVSRSVGLTVVADGTAYLKWTDPAPNSSWTTPGKVPFAVTAVDPGGVIRRVEFFADDVRVGVSELTTEEVGIPGQPRQHSVAWENPPVGAHRLLARAVSAAGGEVRSVGLPIVVVGQGPPAVTVAAVRPYALEGDPANRGEFVLERTGGTEEPLTVYVGFGGEAGRGKDYRLVLDPCDECARPEITLIGDEVVFPAGRSSVTLGVIALHEGDEALPEPPTEAVRLSLLTPPIPAVIGAVPPYLAGNPDQATVWVVDRVDPSVPEVILVEPAPESVLPMESAHRLLAVAVDPAASIRRLEFLADDRVIGVSEILTKEVDIPGRLRVHEFLWWPKLSLESGMHLLAARAQTAAVMEVKSKPVKVELTSRVDDLPTVTIRPAKSPASETGELVRRTGSFTVRREGGAEVASPLDLWVQIGGSATWGVDYQWNDADADGSGLLPAFGPFRAVRIPAGAAEGTLVFTAIPDQAEEGTETVTLTLIEPPIIALDQGILPFPPSYRIGDPSAASVEIADSEVSEPKVVLEVARSEFPAGATVSLTASAIVPGQAIGGIRFLANGREIGQVPYCCDTCRCVPPVEGAQFSATFEWVNVPAGKYALTAQALTYANNLWESDPVYIRVGETAAKLSIVSPTHGTVFALGEGFAVSTIGVDPEGTIGLVEFFANGLKIGSSCHSCEIDAQPQPGTLVENTIQWRPEVAGGYVLTAVAQAANGTLVSAEPVSIRVGEAKGPMLTMVAPVNGVTVRAGAPVLIDTVGAHPGGWVNTVEFFANGSKIGESCLACVIDGLILPGRELHNRLEWTPAKPGSYVLTAVGQFSPEGKATSVPVVVRVTTAESTGSLTITDPADGATMPAGSPVKVTAVGRGREGGITDALLLVDGQPAGESHIRFIRAPGADEEVVHAFSVRLPEGPHELVVQDLADRTIKSAAVRVVAAGTGASLTWVQPAEGSKLPSGVPVVLEVNATEPGGLLMEVDFIADGAVIGRSVYSCETCRPAPGAPLNHRLVWNVAPVGEHRLIARAVRADGSAVESAPRSFTVSADSDAPLKLSRQLPSTYAAGVPFTVRIVAEPGSGVSAYVVEDLPPFALPTPGVPGSDEPLWQIVNISDGGVFDPATATVKFGPFFDRSPRTLHYDVLPNRVVEVAEFSGKGSADGSGYPIAGDRILRGQPRHPADRDPADNAISANELTAYAAAWKREEAWPIGPNPIPMDLVTRAAALWKSGERYRPAGTANGGTDWISGLPGEADGIDAAMPPVAGTALRLRTARADGSTLVTLRVLAAPGIRGFALEERLPDGATLTDVSADGAWNGTSRVLRWGPFFSGVNPVVSYVVRSGSGLAKGSVSFDGLSLPIHDVRGDGGTASDSQWIAVDALPDGSHQVSLDAAALLDGAEFELEISGDLRSWTPAGAFAPEQGGGFANAPAPGGAEVRFYRAVRKR